MTEKYNSIIKEQLKEGIIERVSSQPIQPASEGVPPQPIQPASEGVPPQPIQPASEGVPPQPIQPASEGVLPQPIQPASEGVPPQPIQPASEGVPLQPIPPASEGVASPQNPTTKSREFYLPHKYVLRETAQTTKMRIVYDASARPTPEAPSLNDCLYTGPTLQNKLWDVLFQQRIYPVIVSGDIKQAFLQIRVKQSERDALRFHWRSDAEARIETYRFTRVLFGLAPSPFC